jgi:lipopolysaccharide/colanic/teichoic acid biosynthesis glycosyltransferase
MHLFNFNWTTEQPTRRRIDRKSSSRTPTAIAANRGLCGEDEFLRFLYLERRRSERSSRPLCLVLLDGAEILEIDTRETAFKQVYETLRASIRETDAIGWYQESCALGILFSDLNCADKPVVNTLREKVSNAVNGRLPPILASRIPISVHVFPSSNNLNTKPADLTLYPDLPHQARARRTSHVLKRVIDVAGSLCLLCLLGPLLVVVALAIKLTSQGPALFRQSRIGQYAKPFSFLKFRSMCVNNDVAIHKDYVTKLISLGQVASETKPVFKITNDPRVTPVGRFLRKTSIDELPQLWNVLCGQMSLVGPRPPLPYELDCYALWHRRRVLEVKPGITGLWQVTGRSRTTFNEMVRLDLRYAKQWSLWLDIKILLQTPKAVLMGEGAY